MDPEGFTIVFWLPNAPSTQGEIIAAMDICGRVGDQIVGITQVVPDYPEGLGGAVVRLAVTFEPVENPPLVLLGSYDKLLAGAFSPWPRRAED